MTPRSDKRTSAATASSNSSSTVSPRCEELVPGREAARVLLGSERDHVAQVRVRRVADRRRSGRGRAELDDVGGEAAARHRRLHARLEEEHAEVGVREQERQLGFR